MYEKKSRLSISKSNLHESAIDHCISSFFNRFFYSWRISQRCDFGINPENWEQTFARCGPRETKKWLIIYMEGSQVEKTERMAHEKVTPKRLSSDVKEVVVWEGENGNISLL